MTFDYVSKRVLFKDPLNWFWFKHNYRCCLFKSVWKL